MLVILGGTAAGASGVAAQDPNNDLAFELPLVAGGQVNSDGVELSKTYPYRAVGLFVSDSAGVYRDCVGTLVGPGLVVTAASCVWRGMGGDQYFIPAPNGQDEPFGVWRIEQVAMASEFAGVRFDRSGECSDPENRCGNDIAIARLQTKFDRFGREYRLGEKIGWMQLAQPSPRAEHADTEVSRLFALSVLSITNSVPTILDPEPPIVFSPLLVRTDTTTALSWGAEGTIGPLPAPLIPGAPVVRDLGPFMEYGAPQPTPVESQIRPMVWAVTNFSSSRDVSRYISFFDQQNIGELYDAFCAAEPKDCVYTPVDSEPSPIRLTLEEPANAGAYNGIGVLRGWAAYEFGIERVDVYIDGEFAFNAPYGGERLDVAEAFPELEGARHSGFGLAFSYGDLAPGTHTLSVVAVSTTAETAQASATFTVERFHKPFIDARDTVSVDTAAFSGAGKTLEIKNIVIDDVEYDLTLDWDTAAQDFEISAIRQRN